VFAVLLAAAGLVDARRRKAGIEGKGMRS